MNELAQEILEGLQETIDFISGKPIEGKAYFVFEGRTICLQEIREKLGMNREQFAKSFLFKLNTVRNWEQGVRKPNGHTLAYLSVIAADPVGTLEKLQGLARV
jgi:putative transcriptional regulator